MQAILNDGCEIGKAVKATVISFDDAPQGYEEFDSWAAKKFALYPHGLIS
jgi:glutathione-independent formaldehyde dehydrogenase